MEGMVDRWMDRCWEELMFDRWILYIKYHFMRRTTWYYCRWCVTCKWISCSVIFCQYKLRNVFFFYHTVSFLTLVIRNMYIKYHFMRRSTWYYCRWYVPCKWISCSVIFCQYKLRIVLFFYHTVSFLTLGIRNKLSFSKINTARSIISESAQCWVLLSFCLLIPFLICLLSWCWFWLREAQCLWYIYKMTES